MRDQPAETSGTSTQTRFDIATPARFTPRELQAVFRRMVADELRRGPLPYRRRRKLMRYAVRIGIKPFKASLLIAEAQREAGHLDDPDVQRPDITTLIHPERWPIWFKLSAALIIAMLVDVVVIRTLGW